MWHLLGVPIGEGEDIIPCELAPLAAMVTFFWNALVFSKGKNGESLYFPQTAPLIVPDKKVTASALNAVV